MVYPLVSISQNQGSSLSTFKLFLDILHHSEVPKINYRASLINSNKYVILIYCLVLNLV